MHLADSATPPESSLAVFDKLWKQKIINKFNLCLQNIIARSRHSDVIVVSSWYYVFVKINGNYLIPTKMLKNLQVLEFS